MTKDAMLEYLKEFCSKQNVTSGFTQENQVGFQLSLITNQLGVEIGELMKTGQVATGNFTKADFVELASILELTCNGSALRQSGEKAGFLKTTKTKSAAGLEEKYGNI
jgi:hypothetical protein